MNSSTQKNCTIDNMNAFERGVKRAFDCIGALLGLICLSPVFLVIYVMQKIEGEGPAIFSQERIGKNGNPFRIYKFRTMIVDSEVDGPCLAQSLQPSSFSSFGLTLSEPIGHTLSHLESILVMALVSLPLSAKAASKALRSLYRDISCSLLLPHSFTVSSGTSLEVRNDGILTSCECVNISPLLLLS